MTGSQPSPLSGTALPPWATELVVLYESNAASQFIIHGNVYDRLVVPGASPTLGTLPDFLLSVLLARFDVVLSYDLGNGIRVEKGGPIFATWPFFKDNPQLPKAPRAAMETLTHYLRYCAHLRRLSDQHVQVACVVRDANLIAPPAPGSCDYDLGALITLIREWANDSLLTGHAIATFLTTENLNDLSPLIVNNPRAAKVQIPLPGEDELRSACTLLAQRYPAALREYAQDSKPLTQQLIGSTIGAFESLIKTRQHAQTPLNQQDLVRLKKRLVERDCSGLIEFVESKRTLDDLHGQDKVKEWLRQDIALWKTGDTAALPKGYLICGPVGTGKTFMAECLAGEAGVPVVKLKNFRDRWVGSTEGNLEKIFRLLKALDRCYVFVDEADQALGRRDAGANDSGISGRIYSMIAEEMGSSASRGKVIWILASSRPDLIEVDLKRPGRVDVKIPLFPTITPREGFDLIRSLMRARSVELPEDSFSGLSGCIPLLLTPGAAEALAVKVYRGWRTKGGSAAEVLRQCLDGYQSPVAPEILQFQIQLAVREASDLSFVPACFLEEPRT